MSKPKDWGQPCPNPDWTHSRWMNRGNLRALSTDLTQSGKRRIVLCHACEATFSATRETVFFDLRTPEEKGMRARKRLLVTVGLSAMGFVLSVTEPTVLLWRARAAHKAHEMHAHLLRGLPVPQGPLDAMWRFIKRKQAQPADAEGERSDLSEDGRQWVWSSCAPAFRRILAAVVGPRTCVSAVPLMQMTAAGGLGVPCFFRDGSRCSLSALIAGYHT